MNIEEQKKEKKPLYHREEIQIKVKNYEETPSRKEIMNKISAELGYDKENTVIDKIDQERGKKESTCKIEVYESPEHLKKYTKQYKVERTEKEEEEE